LIKDIKHRFFPVGEGGEGWNLMIELLYVQECDARKAK